MGKETKTRTLQRKDDKIATAASHKSVSLASLSNSSYVHIGCMVLLIIITYSNTLSAPFQWDEGNFIVSNPIIKDIHYFIRPSEAQGFKFYYSFLMLRYIGFLTFALNYGIHGFSVAGYHIVNITIHIANSILVYLLVLLTFRTPFFTESAIKQNSRHIAFFSSMLFAVHPLQTTAVTYVFQRFVPLAAFFYLLSLTAYIKSRLSASKRQSLSYYGISFISAVLAMKTKEIAFTLPIVITLFEFLFFRDTMKRRTLFVAPLLLTMSVIPLTVMRLMGTMSKGADSLPGYVSAVFSRAEYMLTEFRVIVTYLRLLFMPVNQNLDYDYPVFKSLFDPQVLLSFLFLAALFFVGVYLAGGNGSKSKGSPSIHFSPDLRLMGFGILWFFIALSVESSVIPLTRLIDEYRVYLPSVGISIAMVTGIFLIKGRLQSIGAGKLILVSLVLVVGALAITAYQRNEVWGDYVGMWEDTAKKSPMKDTVHNNLGWAYQTRGMFDKAIQEYLIAIKINPDYAETHNNLGCAYQYHGMPDKAIEEYLIAIKLNPNFAGFYNNLGYAYETRGMFDKAMEEYLIAIKLNPNFAEPHFSLGYLYYRTGQMENARREVVTELKIQPDDQRAQQLLNQIIGNR